MTIHRIFPLAALLHLQPFWSLAQTPSAKSPAPAPASASSAAAAEGGREEKAPRKRPDRNGGKQTESAAARTAPHAQMDLPAPATEARAQAIAAPGKGERIVFIGNGLAERDVFYSRLETELQLRYPEAELFVRNMARSGDTPAFRPHPARVRAARA